MFQDEFTNKLAQLSDYTSRYQVDAELGRGGMGVVDQIFDKKLERYIASKRLHDNLCQEEELRARLAREALITAQLDHPNIAAVHDVAVDDYGHLYFTTKLVRGRSLSDVLHGSTPAVRQNKDLKRLISVVLSVCDALEYAHARGVVHRDLKPDNVMVGTCNEVFLMDWGIAKILTQPESEDAIAKRASQALQKHRLVEDESVSTLACTPEYAAPEQIFGRHQDIDVRTDVFGIGAILFEIALGHGPFHAEPIQASILLAMQPLEVSVLRDSSLVHPRLAAIIEKALSFEIGNRYPTIRAFREDLESFLDCGWAFERRVVPAGTLIVREGHPANEMFIITEGSCSAYKTADGPTRVLRQMETGDVFGETGVFGTGVRTANVRADTDSTLAVITRKDLKEQLHFGFWMSIPVRALAKRFAEKDATLTQLERKYEALSRITAWLSTAGHRTDDGRWVAPFSPLCEAWCSELGDGDEAGETPTRRILQYLAQIYSQSKEMSGSSIQLGPFAVDLELDEIALWD